MLTNQKATMALTVIVVALSVAVIPGAAAQSSGSYRPSANPYGYARPSGHSAGYYGSRAVFYGYGAALGAAGYVYGAPPPPGYMGQTLRAAGYNARQFVNPQVWRPTRRVYRHMAYGR